MAYEFRLPDIGEGLHEAEILTWFKKVGDQVKENENIVEVQTDKAVVEISSPVTGTVQSLLAEVGEVVKVGEVLFTVLEEQKVGVVSSIRQQKSAQQDPQPVEQPAFAQTVSAQQDSSSVPVLPKKKRVIAAPSVRKLARELGVDITLVPPTGRGGKVTEEDVQNYISESKKEVAAAIAQTPAQETVADGRSASYQSESMTTETTQSEWKMAETEGDVREPIRGLRKRIYENMKQSKYTAVHCTGMDEVIITKLVELRKQLQQHAEKAGVKLTYLPFFVKAVAKALKRHPLFNATVDDEKMEIVYKKHIHIGVAMATNEGLIVPVIKHADRKSVLEIAEEIQELSGRARERKLTLNELTGSTFTVSSTGGKGGWFATPVINYPEVAILGVHSIKKKPIVQDDQIIIGDVMGMSITFDHRVIDGAPANAFMEEIHTLLENPELFILDGR